ncbi:SDR family oxidoreductase [Mucilaginibacter aquatilis]|uniref:NAD(P)H-binding protein n=1 Tax=Mucilaginibacter aquatilis TaxID=1517760 RepID=A0A6I4I8H0_9SPHI|nr:SDR family oxidoreductase [Mucilaginibacter aquatilis]MVN91545.1 NAD(P)H-binding protein [Mucilaginibacter aquatilis]
MKYISILGCGWYGLPLAKALCKQGYVVKGSTTTPSKIEVLNSEGINPFVIDLNGDNVPADSDFFNCDLLIISIPPKLRKGEHEQYLSKIKSLVNAIQTKLIKSIIFISSTGVYPEVNGELSELSDIEPDTLSGKTLLSAENILRDALADKLTVIRFAGLVGPGRNPGRFFAGKENIANGQAPINLIHLDDCIEITMAIISNNLYGYTINACTPHHPTKSDFYTKAAANVNLPLPQFKDELEGWKIIKCVKIEELLNYQFKVNDWNDYLKTDSSKIL